MCNTKNHFFGIMFFKLLFEIKEHEEKQIIKWYIYKKDFLIIKFINGKTKFTIQFLFSNSLNNFFLQMFGR